MAENRGASRVSAQPRPTITLPARSSVESWFGGGVGASPGPMTLVSSFFSDNYPDSECRSFSQLLAGAMASPVAAAAAARPLAGNSAAADGVIEGGLGDGGENLGFKQNRPVGLVVTRSPVFTVPPGLSPSGLLNSPGFFSPVQGPFGMSHQQALAQVTAHAVLSQSHMHIQSEYQPTLLATPADPLAHNPSLIPNATVHQQMPPVASEHNSTFSESSEVSHADRKSQPPSIAVDKPADDGYNWRKYGQKQVKGSEYPRSYYRCTHLNCPVKKKVERSLDGQITEIIYKGQHNHELPQPNKRAKDGSDLNGNVASQAKSEPNLQGLVTMNTSTETIPNDSLSGRDQDSAQAATMQFPGSSDSEDVGDAEERHNEGDDDKPNPKRRNIELGTSEPSSSHKTVTEPRIIVQTRSEVDLLDDGYRWRKYGQKVVKGNPHPRSYYKCTSVGCNVRKHVERASTDPKAVITTYEGKHNHDIPAARNSSHNSANSAPQPKPLQHKVAAEKHALLKEMEFGNNEQRSVALLQLKEEKIAV